MSGVRKTGFTLVELLVVIAIIGILVSLLLPAVQTARESGRRATCSNNVHQLALAALQHHEKNGFFPTGGWGWRWAGEPDRGFTKKQPGGWCYNILPYMDQVNLWELGRKASSNPRAAIAKRVGTPLTILTCASRRNPLQYPYVHGSPYFNCDRPTVIARTDYAVNGGSVLCGWSQGPDLNTDPETFDYGSCRTTGTGICLPRGEIRTVPDGESNTYLIGERYANPDAYMAGTPRRRSRLGCRFRPRHGALGPERIQRPALPRHAGRRADSVVRQRPRRRLERELLRRLGQAHELRHRSHHAPALGQPQGRRSDRPVEVVAVGCDQLADSCANLALRAASTTSRRVWQARGLFQQVQPD